jgi:hypothetical protein
MLCGADAVVYESAGPIGAITAVRSFERACPASAAESNAIVSGDPQLAKIAEWLERERAARSYQRLKLVGSASRLRGLLARMSAPALALVTTARSEDLSEIQTS